MTSDAFNEQEFQKIVELAKERAKRICAISDSDLLSHPDDEFITIPLNTLHIYQRVRIFAAGFSELKNFPESSPVDRETAVKNVLLQMQPVYKLGVELMAERSGKDLNSVALSNQPADLIEMGIQEKCGSDEIPKGTYVFFFILALDELLEFMDLYSAAFRTKSALRKSSGRDSSNIQVIRALGCLLHAQLALEKGMHYVTVSLGVEKVGQLNRELAEKSAQVEQARSADAKKAADARHAETRDARKDLFEWYKQNADKYPSIEAAAEAAVKIVPYKHRTVRDWISQFQKQLQSARTL